MNAEEQLRQMRETTHVSARTHVKNRIISLVMMAIASMGAVFGYKQQIEAKAQRSEVIRLHREIKRLSEEVTAAHGEATKWRSMLEGERKKSAVMQLELQKKSKK